MRFILLIRGSMMQVTNVSHSLIETEKVLIVQATNVSQSLIELATV